MTATEKPALDGYQGMRWLGGGGQGEVYLATDGAGRRVVVKVARRDRPGAAASLEREAAALARLGPPSTPRLLAREITRDGDPALVVEHVPWPDLRRVLEERGALAVPEALAIGDAIIAALRAVHRAGLVHGDLAPANVLCRVAPPAVRLIDVGASATARAEPVVATLPYCAPELLEADAAPDPRSDVYGLGALVQDRKSVV